MTWELLVDYISKLWNGILTLATNVRDFMLYEVSVLGIEINVFGILFGVGFSAWVIYKAIT